MNTVSPPDLDSTKHTYLASPYCALNDIAWDDMTHVEIFFSKSLMRMSVSMIKRDRDPYLAVDELS
jgi:hypothetical protein